MSELLSDEDLLKPAEQPKAAAPKAAAASKPLLSDEDLLKGDAAAAPKPEGGKILDNAGDDTVGRAMAKGMVTGAAKVGLALNPATWPAIARDTGNLLESGAENYVRKGANLLGAGVEDPGVAGLMKRNSEAMPDFINQFPSPQESYETGKGIPGQIALKDYLGEYKPETWYGRMGQAAFEAALARNPKNLLNAGEGLGAAAAGAAAQGVGDVTGDPMAAMAAGVMTPKLVAGGMQRVNDRLLNATSPAQELARRVVQEAPDDGLGVAGRMNAQPNDITSPNTVMQSQDRGVAALSNALERGDENFKAANEGVADTNSQLVGAASEKVQQPAAAQIGSDMDAATAGLTGTSKSNVSKDAHSIVDTLWDADKANERAVWDAWRQRGDGVVKLQNMQDGLNAYINSLPIRDRRLLREQFDLTGADLTERANRNYSDVTAMQDLRSELLKMARNTEDRQHAMVYGDAADRVRDLMMDKNNYRFNSGKNSAEWDKAVQTTKDFHDTWGDKTTQWMKDGTKDEGAFLNRVLKGQDAGKRTAELMAKAGNDPQMVQAITDWHMADLTNGGVKTLKPEQVEAYIAKNGAVISQVPGLEQKLRDFGYLTRKQQISDLWDKAQQDPTKLVKFLGENGDEVRQLADPATVDGLEQAARQLNALKGKGAVNSQTFNDLQKGRAATLLYGSTVPGAVGRAALGALAVHLVPPELRGEAVAVLAAWATGEAAHHVAPNTLIGKLVTRLTEGDVQGRANDILREALKDPKKWEELRRMDPRETAQTLFGTGVGQTAVGAAIGTHEGVSSNQERNTDE